MDEHDLFSRPCRSIGGASGSGQSGGGRVSEPEPLARRWTLACASSALQLTRCRQLVGDAIKRASENQRQIERRRKEETKVCAYSDFHRTLYCLHFHLFSIGVSFSLRLVGKPPHRPFSTRNRCLFKAATCCGNPNSILGRCCCCRSSAVVTNGRLIARAAGLPIAIAEHYLDSGSPIERVNSR